MLRTKLREAQLLRAAAYIRVSTNIDDQENSFDAQKKYFEELLSKNEQYESAGIYSDYGISGTSIRNREGMQSLLLDCKKGRFNRIYCKSLSRFARNALEFLEILTKSISRFARNTIDTLSWIQRLRNLPNPVQVKFEKEGFESFYFGSEMILTVMSAFAQAKSRSISDNVKWALLQNFKNGKLTINLDRMLGYDMGSDGKWIINEEQAAVVREIYNMYLCGLSAHRIAALMNEKGVFTINGNKWTAQSILIVLRNEKYVGDLTMQKSITFDMLAHKVVKNEGIAKQFHIRDHHTPIIERDVWDRVQKMVEHNTFDEAKIKSKDRYAVLSNLYCGTCGKPYLRDHYSTKVLSMCTVNTICKFGHPIWKCEKNSKVDISKNRLKKGMKRCDSEYLHECAIYQSFMEKLYQIKADIKEKEDNAEVAKDYYDLCLDHAKENDSIIYRDYSEVVERITSVKNSIKELAENQEELATVLGESGMFQSLINDYESQLKELEKHKEELITKILLSDSDVKQFDYFVDQILTLPDKAANGNELNIQMVDNTDCNTDSIYDLLPFDKAFYLTFIESGTVFGDMITYKTKFGVNFDTIVNTRIMEEFIGYKKTDHNGNSIIIKDAYQVYDFQLQYIKKKTG